MPPPGSGVQGQGAFSKQWGFNQGGARQLASELPCLGPLVSSLIQGLPQDHANCAGGVRFWDTDAKCKSANSQAVPPP